MAQTASFTIANDAGAAVRARINEVIAALQSTSAGASAPRATMAGMLWVDTSVSPPVLRRRNATNTGWDALLDIVTSANIACGAHAGDPETMAKTIQLALAKGVAIGAHPGFADLHGFGRRRMQLSADALDALVRAQVATMLGMAQSYGATLAHVKLHGALANMTAEDQNLARICYTAAHAVAPDAKLLVIAATAQEAAAKDLGIAHALEIFADRAYNEDATLVDRREAGAVLHDPELIANRVVTMIQEQAIITKSNARLPTQIDSICVHGDTPHALLIAREIKETLSSNGIKAHSF